MNENFWSSVKEVSNGETGKFPRITAYKNEQMDYVYFMYGKTAPTNYECKWRRYNVTSDNWHTPLYTAPINNINIMKFSGFRVDDSNVIIYYRWYEDIPWRQEFFRWVILDLYNNWIDYSYSDVNNAINDLMYSTPTLDGKTHTALYFVRFEDQIPVVGLWRSYTADTVYPPDPIYGYEEPEDSIWHLNLSSAGNEVHVIWQDPFGSNYVYNLRYKYDDQTPLAPTRLTITEDASNHPRLNWNASPEPDRNVYKIYRYDTYGGGWQYLNQTTNTTFTDQTLTYCHAIPPAQCPDVRTFYSRVTVVDYGLHESLPSNQVEARLQGGPPPKIVADPNSNETIEYSLEQNYPNPFNPVTTIKYSIKTAGEITLKVYDVLGKEVASLVNENQEPGSYSVNFNAANLPSGIYVYRLTSGNFVDTKKLILLK